MSDLLDQILILSQYSLGVFIPVVSLLEGSPTKGASNSSKWILFMADPAKGSVS
ncbi:hypothetical protein C8R42DRAFT_727424 [Lentinula raphanica]|nr:hypothetical protein C8R42DRAFT_727424 [Lentinula raphanica]